MTGRNVRIFLLCCAIALPAFLVAGIAYQLLREPTYDTWNDFHDPDHCRLYRKTTFYILKIWAPNGNCDTPESLASDRIVGETYYHHALRVNRCNDPAVSPQQPAIAPEGLDSGLTISERCEAIKEHYQPTIWQRLSRGFGPQKRKFGR